MYFRHCVLEQPNDVTHSIANVVSHMYMDIHVFSILARKQQKEEKEKHPPPIDMYIINPP